MTRYLFYFHYWLSIEPIQAVIDFDPQDKAKILFEEVYEEITYHIGEEPNPESLLFVEIFGLRPFNPIAWEMSLEQFVGDYGNEFVVFDLERLIIGDIEHFRPKQIAGGRNKFIKISIKDNEWDKRAKFETRLVSTLIRYFQFYKKTKWLLVLPLDGLKNNYRVWKVTSSIPESDYTAEWRIILPNFYPEQPPKLFIRNKDVNVVNDFDFSLIWKDSDGTIFYHITDVTVDSTNWEEDNFLVDFLLTGVWNFLVRSLKTTFERLLFYKINVNSLSVIKETTREKNNSTKQLKKYKPSEEDSEEEEGDWRVQITEVLEDIVFDQHSLNKKLKNESKKDPNFEMDEYSTFDDNNYSEEKGNENDQAKKNNFKEKKSQESKFQDWVIDKSDVSVLKNYAIFFTWLLQRVPERALKELNQLKEFDSEHEIFELINWRLVQDEISENKLLPFATNIVNYYLEQVEKELYDSDRDFLRETVLKKWKDVEKVPKLRELLKDNVNRIRVVEYENLN